MAMGETLAIAFLSPMCSITKYARCAIPRVSFGIDFRSSHQTSVIASLSRVLPPIFITLTSAVFDFGGRKDAAWQEFSHGMHSLHLLHLAIVLADVCAKDNTYIHYIPQDYWHIVTPTAESSLHSCTRVCGADVQYCRLLDQCI